MASIIQPALFIGENNIPGKTEIGENLQWFIDKYEALFLTELLGAEMAESFINGLPQGTVETQTGSDVVTGTGTSFTTMFDVGDTITINNETHTITTISSNTSLTTDVAWSQFNGNSDYYGKIKWVELLNLKSVKPAIVDYVYWFYLQDQNTVTATTGGAKPKQQNSTNASAYPKMVRAWNEMVKMNRETNKFLSGKATYPEYTKSIPTWYYWDNWFIYTDWFYELPEIYRIKNSLGI